MSDRFRARAAGAGRRGPTVRAQILAGLVAALSLPLGASASASASDDDVVATITDKRIAESSALVVSTVDPKLAYTINDSGNETVVYVLELATGDVVGTATLDVEGEDTEAMAIGKDGRLYVADIGDNDAERSRVTLYAIDQPGRGDTTVTAEAYDVRYRGGPANAETLLSDPVTGRLAIVTKDFLSGQVLRLPDPLRADRVNVARPIRGVTVPGLVTDGAYLPDRSGVVLRTYVDVVVYALPGWRELDEIDTPPLQQSESLAVLDDGRSMLVGTEKLPAPIVKVAVPDEIWNRLHTGPSHAGDAEPRTESASGPAADEDSGIGRGWVLASGGALVVLGVAWLWTARRRPRNRRRA